ncbi:MAG: DUF4277 domain-containing protein [Planctomycetota bacterium]|nr:DUF4277 domain-containing protein [Planctomycetota bacterium]
MATRTSYDTQIVGAFPVISEYLRKLDFAGVINRIVPWEGNIPLGTLAEIFVLNRMLEPKALMRVGEWAEQVGLTKYYGLSAEQRNDDLLGRALERLHQYQAEVEVGLSKSKGSGLA